MLHVQDLLARGVPLDSQRVQASTLLEERRQLLEKIGSLEADRASFEERLQTTSDQRDDVRAVLSRVGLLVRCYLRVVFAAFSVFQRVVSVVGTVAVGAEGCDGAAQWS